jgi:hypothetical protein
MTSRRNLYGGEKLAHPSLRFHRVRRNTSFLATLRNYSAPLPTPNDTYHGFRHGGKARRSAPKPRQAPQTTPDQRCAQKSIRRTQWGVSYRESTHRAPRRCERWPGSSTESTAKLRSTNSRARKFFFSNWQVRANPNKLLLRLLLYRQSGVWVGGGPDPFLLGFMAAQRNHFGRSKKGELWGQILYLGLEPTTPAILPCIRLWISERRGDLRGAPAGDEPAELSWSSRGRWA